MNLKVSSFRIEVLSEKHDFNWAVISFSLQSEEGGDFGSTIEVRVPKTITDIESIRTYALDRVRSLDLTGI